MEYTARHYIRLNGRMVTPGEIVTMEETDGKTARLLRMGALEPVKSIWRGVRDTPDEEPDDPDRDTTDEQDAPDEDAADEGAPEIDAMDGIVVAGKTTKRGRAKA
ncbi:MAG: hypothetical protein ACI4PG_06545 [Candidatus Ventricola sp.]